MAPITVNLSRVEFDPTDDGDRVNVTEGTPEESTFSTAEQCAAWLIEKGITFPSSTPDFQTHVWFTDEPYRDLYTGRVTEWSVRNANLVRSSVADWRAVWELVTRS